MRWLPSARRLFFQFASFFQQKAAVKGIFQFFHCETSLLRPDGFQTFAVAAGGAECVHGEQNIRCTDCRKGNGIQINSAYQ
ncbi:MAG: hypothetical protein ACLR5S_09590 [Ruminococcus sp.]